VQGKFKKVPQFTMYMAAELPIPFLKLRFVVESIVKVIMVFARTKIKGLRWGLGDRGRCGSSCGAEMQEPPLAVSASGERPHLAMPLGQVVDSLVITAVGEDPPSLFDEPKEAMQARDARQSGKSPVCFDLGPTYTFSFFNNHTDFCNWAVADVPTGPVKLTSFIKNTPIDFVVYDLSRVAECDSLELTDVTFGGGASTTGPPREGHMPHDSAHKRHFVHIRLSYDECVIGGSPLLPAKDSERWQAPRAESTSFLTAGIGDDEDDDEWYSPKYSCSSDGSFESPNSSPLSSSGDEVRIERSISGAVIDENDAAARWRAFGQIVQENRKAGKAGIGCCFGFRVLPSRGVATNQPTVDCI